MSVGISLIAIIISLVLISILAFKGHAPYLSVVACILIICVITQTDFNEALSSIFAGGLGRMIIAMAVFFTVSTMLGNLMTESGYAASMADFLAEHLSHKYVYTAIIIMGTLLGGLGGMSLGCIPIIYPIALKMLEKAGYNKRFVLAAIICSFWSFANGTPYLPSTANVLVSSYLGTSASSGGKMGLISGIAMLALDIILLELLCRRDKKKGIGFTSQAELEQIESANSNGAKPNVIISFIPIVIVLVLFNVFHLNAVMAMLISCGFIMIECLFSKRLTLGQVWKAAEKGAYNGVIPTFNLSVMTGFGAVVSATPFFTAAVEKLTTSNANPYIVCFLAANLFAGILGSGSSGLNTFMPAMTPVFQGFASMGYSLDAMHRLLCIGQIGLDSLPHNGSFAAYYSMTNTNPKESYFGIFITCTCIPLLVGICITLPLAMVGFI